MSTPRNELLMISPETRDRSGSLAFLWQIRSDSLYFRPLTRYLQTLQSLQIHLSFARLRRLKGTYHARRRPTVKRCAIIKRVDVHAWFAICVSNVDISKTTFSYCTSCICFFVDYLVQDELTNMLFSHFAPISIRNDAHVAIVCPKTVEIFSSLFFAIYCSFLSLAFVSFF